MSTDKIKVAVRVRPFNRRGMFWQISECPKNAILEGPVRPEPQYFDCHVVVVLRVNLLMNR
jgi:hypothetical protein